MTIRLSPRLQRIADFMPPGSTIADVGTDHAYLPLWLLQTGRCDTAFATELRSGPLQNAASDAAAAGVSDQLTLLLCDGLTRCSPDDVDTVVIAGMGGETIQGILDASPWALEKRLILQPQTKFSELRLFLASRGVGIADAALVYDTGRIYRVWLAASGVPAESGWIESPLLRKRDPLLKAYTEDLIKRLRKQIRGLECATTTDKNQLALLHAELEEYLTIHKEAESWQM